MVNNTCAWCQWGKPHFFYTGLCLKMLESMEAE